MAGPKTTYYMPGALSHRQAGDAYRRRRDEYIHRAMHAVNEAERIQLLALAGVATDDQRETLRKLEEAHDAEMAAARSMALDMAMASFRSGTGCFGDVVDAMRAR